MFPKTTAWLTFNNTKNPLHNHKGILTVRETFDFEHIINDKEGKFDPKGWEIYLKLVKTLPKLVWAGKTHFGLKTQTILLNQNTAGPIHYYFNRWGQPMAYIKINTTDGDRVKLSTTVDIVKTIIKMSAKNIHQ